jgi:hypothetical protein
MKPGIADERNGRTQRRLSMKDRKTDGTTTNSQPSVMLVGSIGVPTEALGGRDYAPAILMM